MYGALSPSEIDHLSGIIERHCLAHGIQSVAGRESVAASAVLHYQRGVTDEAELLQILAREDDPQRAARKPAAGSLNGYNPSTGHTG